MTSDPEETCIRCDFCVNENGIKDWHEERFFQKGVVTDEYGIKIEVLWCAATWKAFYKVKNLLIREKNENLARHN